VLEDFLLLSSVKPFSFSFGADFDLHAVVFDRAE